MLTGVLPLLDELLCQRVGRLCLPEHDLAQILSARAIVAGCLRPLAECPAIGLVAEIARLPNVVGDGLDLTDERIEVIQRRKT